MSLASYHSFCFNPGFTFNPAVRDTEDDQAINYENVTDARFQIFNVRSDTVVHEANLTNFQVILGLTNGIIQINIPPAVTATLTENRYDYKLWVERNTGEKTLIMKGPLYAE